MLAISLTTLPIQTVISQNVTRPNYTKAWFHRQGLN